ncbi:MAG: 1-phosphofructokinase family hexose kinase [Saprospiraceae bacterium]|nr:1-phosphofructokinase family hexose kinase [Saprospiraceae bacterium]
MVLTITLNPSIDISVMVPQLIPTDKLRCERYEKEVGGGGINVAKGLRRLGIPTEALFFSGGHNGQFIESKLLAESLIIHPLRLESETRENITVTDQSNQLEYRLVNKGNVIHPENEDLLMSTIDRLELKPGYLVLSGSHPPGLSGQFVKKIAAWCQDHHCRLVLDLPAASLAETFEFHPHLIKPNLKELSQIAGKSGLTGEEAGAIAWQWVHKGYASVIVISMGDQGAIICSNNEIHQIVPPKVKSLSTVGAGDSMVAGLIYKLHQESDLYDVLAMGIACGTAATLSRGTKLFDRDQALLLYERIKSGSG